MLKLDVFDINKFIQINKSVVHEVTDNIFFDKDKRPTPNGLFSYELFGTTPRERKSNWGYIDLQNKFINPVLYITFKKLIPTMIDGIISGMLRVNMDKDGILVVDQQNGFTGLKWLYDNFEKIKWKETGSDARASALAVIRNIPKNEIFIDKFLVIPPFYRDVNFANDNLAVDVVNNYYADILKKTKLLANNNDFDFMSNKTTYGIQTSLNELYNYFIKQEVARGKYGKLRKYLMGKTITNGARAVISSPRYYDNNISTNPVDFYHTGVPLGMICSEFYPFVYKNLVEIFNEMDNVRFIWADPQGTQVKSFNNPRQNFDSKFIDGLLKTYIKAPPARFNKIEVKVDGYKEPLHMYMKITDKSGTEIIRPMTITDILYQAASAAIKDKYVVVSRYPFTEYSNMFTNKPHILTTIKTMWAKVGDVEYPYYPIIDLRMTQNQVSNNFSDTVQFSNLYTAGLNADYDGDQISIRGVWTQEGNKSCEKFMLSIRNVLNANGQINRVTKNETLQTLYNLTKGVKKIK